MNKRAAISAAALIGTVGIGIGAAQLAMADPSPSPSTPSSSATASATAQPESKHGDRGPDDRGGRGKGGPGGMSAADTATLAKKLGVDEAKLTTAIKAAREATKPTAPASSDTTTEAQREAERTAREKAFITALARQLGIDQAKVTTAINELQAAHRAEHVAALKTKLDAAVKAGTLTQADADSVVKAYNAGVLTGAGFGR